ncbi:S1C family serine protease [Roseiconus lacunae]|uniref:S1C family serine protease n=1 Tax=Roseiconus lacunae TaxID=2605694 RepID=UPI001E30F459|nr:trypsin-like peptidase domain-containing protein [Roseiconus lacunae]MCD0463378.1 S1C family serine protease [Roseiconus lacunae]
MNCERHAHNARSASVARLASVVLRSDGASPAAIFCGALLCGVVLMTCPASAVAQTIPGPIRPGFGQPDFEQQDVSSARPNAYVARKIPAEGTRVPVPAELEELLRIGGTPDSLEILRRMEDQHRLVAERAAKCTVSVRIGAAQGCGVLITSNGYIVTAAHVAMRPGKRAVITLSDGRRVTATTLGMNRHVDAGLIRIDPNQDFGKPWPHASLGKSNNLVPGMWCVAMGHPGGYDASRGPVVRVGRLLDVEPNVIRTDCALIGGDSGGPLFNLAGELVAVHSRIGNDVADNLHVPIDHYDTSWERMAKGEAWGHLPNFKPTLGVTGKKSDPLATINYVSPNSPAEKSGIEVGDVIIEFGEKTISDFESLRKAVADTMPGERVPILLRRNGSTIRISVEIGRSGD